MITINREEFVEAIKELKGIYEKGIPAVAVIASDVINKAATRARNEAIKQLAENYYIDKKPLREALTLTKSKPQTLEASISNNRKRNKDRFTLGRFKVEVPTSGPIKVAQSRSGGLQELKRAFLGEKRGQFGNTQVFRRVGPGRYPLNVERSYSIGGMIDAKNLDKYIEETAQEYVDINFPKKINEFWDKEGM